eukprot:624543-Pyramimonas_sp.AAC.1
MASVFSMSLIWARMRRCSSARASARSPTLATSRACTARVLATCSCCTWNIPTNWAWQEASCTLDVSASAA